MGKQLPMGPLKLAHLCMESHVETGDVVVDATLGNGYDTLHLAQCIGEKGHVLGFDIQEAAVESTRMGLCEAALQERVTLLCRSHAELKAAFDELSLMAPSLLVFNLGYLPGGDKSVVTVPDSTMACLRQGSELLNPGGAISLVAYRGHPGGMDEYEAVLVFLEELTEAGWKIQRSSSYPEDEKRPVFFWAEKPRVRRN